MHGAPALLADLAHLSAGVLWGGAILYTALTPAWRDERAGTALITAMSSVSKIGLGSVLLLSTTGVYTALLHLVRPAELVGTPYGQTLLSKLVLVGVILAVAALNRWWLLPALTRRGQTQPLGRVLKLDAALLLTVFAVTGLLTTQPLPHI